MWKTSVLHTVHLCVCTYIYNIITNLVIHITGAIFGHRGMIIVCVFSAGEVREECQYESHEYAGEG